MPTQARPEPPDAPLQLFRPGLRLELRREDQNPPCWSVRFEVQDGVAWLRLPEGWGRTAASAARSGAASGLYLSDLEQVELMVRQPSGAWAPLRVIEGIDPQRLPLGRWVTLDGPRLQTPTEDALYEELVLIDRADASDDWEDHEGELEETLTDLGRPVLQPVPGAAAPEAPASLVRSLVLRIRQQEREIAALREQLVKLGVTPRTEGA